MPLMPRITGPVYAAGSFGARPVAGSAPVRGLAARLVADGGRLRGKTGSLGGNTMIVTDCPGGSPGKTVTIMVAGGLPP